jgi:protein-S-isoprenylcysteine O-methyltransferase Ste14
MLYHLSYYREVRVGLSVCLGVECECGCVDAKLIKLHHCASWKNFFTIQYLCPEKVHQHSRIKDSLMQTHAQIVWITFSIIGLVMIFVILRSLKYGYSLTGKPTIPPLFFYTAKLSFFLNWMLFLIKALLPDFGYIPVLVSLSRVGTILLVIGSILFIPAVLQLGSSLRYGIPKEETKLKTTGIFRISRNPLYLGMFIICIGSCLYFPDLANVAFCIYTFVIHLKIIKGEEEFLSNRFSKEWTDYTAKVRRLI